MSTRKLCGLLVLVILLWRAEGAAQRLLQSFKFQSPNLFPESFDWDPVHDRFLLGSASKGTISELTNDGSVTEFVRDDEYAGRMSMSGVKVDRKRNRVIAAVNDIVAWNYSGVAAYDLDTKKRLYFARLDNLGVAEGTYSFVHDELLTLAPTFTPPVVILDGSLIPGEGEKSCANDVAVDSTSGDVFVTNSAGNFLWKVTVDGTPSVFVKRESFPVQSVSPLVAESEWSWAGFNGIVYEPRKYLLVVQSNTGALFRVGVEDGSVHVVIMKGKLPWADGMALREDGTLVVVSKHKVWLVGSASDWMAANVVDVVPLNASAYTTAVAMQKRSTFIVHTYLPDLYANRTRDDFEVQEIEFPAEFDDHPVWLIVLIVFIVVVVSLWRFQVFYIYQQYRSKQA